jgi:glycosyltransferase involved in cell wall biosynthesis
MKISGIIITKDVEDQIADCVDSLSFCYEVVVVDNESKDRTVEIAEKMGAKVIKYQTSDFSKLRDMGFKKATGDWIVYIDSDERVTKELVSSIENRVLNIKNCEFSAFKIKRKNFYFGNHEWPYIEKLERVFKKDKLKGWYGELHESPKVEGEIGELDGYLCHFTHKDLRSMLDKTIKWSKIEAELRYRSDHPKMTWWRFPRVMFTAFYDSYFRQKGWKVGAIGLIESMYQAFSMFVTYARLWELQQKKQD